MINMKKTFITLIICSFFFSCISGEKNSESNQNNGFNYSKKNSYFKDKKEGANTKNDHHEGCNAPCCAEE